MSNLISSKNILRAARLFVVLALCATALWQPTPAAPDPSIAMLRDILRVFYPGLFDKGQFLWACAAREIDSAVMRLDEIEFKVTPQRPPYWPEGKEYLPSDLATGKPIPVNNPLLEGYIQINPAGQIERFYVWNSDEVKSAENNHFHALVESHHELTQAEAGAALKQAGARYCPAEKEDFLRSIHPKRFEKFLGPVKITSVEFDSFLNEDREPNSAQFKWSVYVDARLPSGEIRKYSLTFEPFEGALTGIKHVP